jgi:nuclear pore complex protein Nup205
VDFVLGHVLSNKANEIADSNQQRMLRLRCLEFALVCLESFNEDLIILANMTNISVDSAISTSDLSAYIRLHPFARVLEWMLHEKVVAATLDTIHQPPAEVSTAGPDSPQILGILRAVELIIKVLDLQSTYLNIIRPIIKQQPNHRSGSMTTAKYPSFEDALVGHLGLVVDLGSCCGLGHSDLTLASLRLLERISASPKITATWSSNPGTRAHRNKAIIAMEENGENESISRYLICDLVGPLDVAREAEASSYLIRTYILDFLHTSLQESPRKPTIAHLLLGFQCHADSVSIEANSPFDQGTSLFHHVLRVWIETPQVETQGMRQWLVALKSKCLMVLRDLWTSPLTASIIIDVLREHNLAFHLLAHETIIQPLIPWEGEDVGTTQFPLTAGALTLMDFFAHRAAVLEYIALELCTISQAKLPTYKRRIFDVLKGQVLSGANETAAAASIFDLFDFLLPENAWYLPPPDLEFYKGLDIGVCQYEDGNGNGLINVDRLKELLLLKRSENRDAASLISPQDLAAIEREEIAIIEFSISTNRQAQLVTSSVKVLKAWASLLLVMIESNDFQGTVKASFYLQILQTVLPSLQACAAERPTIAFELAKLAKVLLFKLDLAPMEGTSRDRGSQDVGHLVSDRLYQLFEICLQAIGKFATMSELRSVYYSICYRYLTGTTGKDDAVSGSHKALKAIQMYGDRLANVICDDVYSGDPECQTAALLLLNALVRIGCQENNSHMIETLNKVNFVGILVDSLKMILQESVEISADESGVQQHYQDAKLAVLLQLCQTRDGAKHVLHANLFRNIEASGLFSVDPELQIGEFLNLLQL